MVVHSYVLLQCANLLHLKLKDEQELTWREKFGKHKQFSYALLFILITQTILIESGIKNIKFCPMTVFQHFVCIMVSAGSLVWMKVLLYVINKPKPFEQIEAVETSMCDSDFKKIR